MQALGVVRPGTRDAKLTRSLARLLIVPALLLISGAVATAQVTETPVPFDSSGRVQSITPSLAARLGLGLPAWPVQGVYTEVRLYELSSGGFALAAMKDNGVIVRYPITDEQRAMLQVQVTEAMARVGRPATEEDADIISERASGAFMRNQLGLAFTLYGGSLATLADNETLSPALYLMGPAATFFVAGGYVKKHPVSRAQNDLASDGALRAAGMLDGLLFTLGLEEPKGYAAATFAGGLAGTIIGLKAGRGMTDGEAHGTTWGSTSLAATTLGVLGATGALEGDDDGRATVGLLVGAAAVGLPLGLRYVRKARYVVTAGDVTAVALAGGLAVSTALTPIAGNDNVSAQTVFSLATAGFVAGQVIGVQLLAKPFDHTQGEAGLLAVGAGAGALMGGGLAILSKSDNATLVMSMLNLGAIAGVALTENLIEPRKAGTVGRRRAEATRDRGPQLSFSPAALAQTAARIPGRASFLTITF